MLHWHGCRCLTKTKTKTKQVLIKQMFYFWLNNLHVELLNSGIYNILPGDEV